MPTRAQVVSSEGVRAKSRPRMPTEWPALAQYALALGVVALSLFARWLLIDILGDQVPFALMLSALLPLALLVRPGPFLAAAALGWAGALALFVLPSQFGGDVSPHEKTIALFFGPVMGLSFVTAWLSRRVIDTRERDRAALQKSEERLRIAKQAAHFGLHDYDVVNNQVSWDERTRELWGVGPDETITYEVWRDSVDPADRERAERAVAQALEPTGGGRYLAEYRVTNRLDGVTRWMEAAGQTIFRDGVPERLVGTVRDITERKSAEQALVEADRRKDEFLASLSHELRNPLGAIRMALGVLDRAGDDPARARKMSAIIDRQSRQLVRLIDDLLDVSRVTRGKVELRKEPVELAKVLDQAMESVQTGCHERGVRIQVDLPEEPVVVVADAMRMAQVIGNLLSNACRFSERGGVVSLSGRRRDQDAVVRVRDNGPGIAPEALTRIFDMFVQAHDSRDQAAGGLGIGLSLARSLVNMHGGTIEAHSEGLGRGSEFVVRIPAGRKPQPASEALEEARSPNHFRASILAVDDNTDALTAIREILTMAGHEVTTAETGPEALEKASASRPDVILLDIGLPELDGYEVARLIRSQPWGRRMLLIAMTGWGQAEDKRHALNVGFDAHLTKPVDIDELERLLTGSGEPPRAKA